MRCNKCGNVGMAMDCISNKCKSEYCRHGMSSYLTKECDCQFNDLRSQYATAEAKLKIAMEVLNHDIFDIELKSAVFSDSKWMRELLEASDKRAREALKQIECATMFEEDN